MKKFLNLQNCLHLYGVSKKFIFFNNANLETDKVNAQTEINNAVEGVEKNLATMSVESAVADAESKILTIQENHAIWSGERVKEGHIDETAKTTFDTEIIKLGTQAFDKMREKRGTYETIVKAHEKLAKAQVEYIQKRKGFSEFLSALNTANTAFNIDPKTQLDIKDTQVGMTNLLGAIQKVQGAQEVLKKIKGAFEGVPEADMNEDTRNILADFNELFNNFGKGLAIKQQDFNSNKNTLLTNLSTTIQQMPKNIDALQAKSAKLQGDSKATAQEKQAAVEAYLAAKQKNTVKELMDYEKTVRSFPTFKTGESDSSNAVG